MGIRVLYLCVDVGCDCIPSDSNSERTYVNLSIEIFTCVCSTNALLLFALC